MLADVSVLADLSVLASLSLTADHGAQQYW